MGQGNIAMVQGTWSQLVGLACIMLMLVGCSEPEGSIWHTELEWTVVGNVFSGKLINVNNKGLREDALQYSAAGGNTIHWDFGDGETRVQTEPGPISHTYQQDGTYSLLVEELNDRGEVGYWGGHDGPKPLRRVSITFTVPAPAQSADG